MIECHNFTGEIDRVSYRLKGFTSAFLSFFMAYNLNDVIMRKRIEHGMSGTKLYYKWGQMKRRCLSKIHKDYKHYGARGIKVYEPWIYNYPLFREYVMSLPGVDRDEVTLDRIDNDGDYVPGNLRWTTWHNQRLNQRPKQSKLGIVGVYKRESGRYKSLIGIDKKIVHLGTFDTIYEAIDARNQYIKDHKLTGYKEEKL